jgi:hypothetical protein
MDIVLKIVNFLYNKNKTKETSQDRSDKRKFTFCQTGKENKTNKNIILLFFDLPFLFKKKTKQGKIYFQIQRP